MRWIVQNTPVAAISTDAGMTTTPILGLSPSIVTVAAAAAITGPCARATRPPASEGQTDACGANSFQPEARRRESAQLEGERPMTDLHRLTRRFPAQIHRHRARRGKIRRQRDRQ